MPSKHTSRVESLRLRAAAAVKYRRDRWRNPHSWPPSKAATVWCAISLEYIRECDEWRQCVHNITLAPLLGSSRRFKSVARRSCFHLNSLAQRDEALISRVFNRGRRRWRGRSETSLPANENVLFPGER